MTCKVASYKMLVYICDIEVTTNTYYQPQHKGYESREVNFLLKMSLLRKKYFSKTCFLDRGTQCTLIHGYIKTTNTNFVFLLQSMPYDVKIGPHQMKTVIDDENLHKLSFFETC